MAAGATVFVASDAILSVNRFVRPVPHARLVLMVTYHVGQALIVAGVLRLSGAARQASITTGMIIGRRRWAWLTQRPTTRRTVCWSW